jgi:hypothetical protein
VPQPRRQSRRLIPPQGSYVPEPRTLVADAIPSVVASAAAVRPSCLLFERSIYWPSEKGPQGYLLVSR